MEKQCTVTKGAMMESALIFVMNMALIVLTLLKEAHACLLVLVTSSARQRKKKNSEHGLKTVFVAKQSMKKNS